MRWRVFSPGKPKLGFAADGIAFYTARLKQFAAVELVFAKPGNGARSLPAQTKGDFRVVLDERGTLHSSRGLAESLAQWQAAGQRNFALIAGGADGLPAEIRDAADCVWSLSPAVLQHEVALLVALEQLYRACCINAGHPYHRD